jgi:hypothetical protein
MFILFFVLYCYHRGAHSGTVGGGTALQAVMSREFFIDIILPSRRTMVLGSTHSLTDMSIRNISWGVKAAGA